MATTNRSERVRFRYGICLNDSCSKCKSKEVQEISARKEFVCAECGKPLRECPPPTTWWQKNGKKVITGVVALVFVGGGIFLSTLGGGSSDADDKGAATEKVDSAATDSIVKDTAAAAPVKVDEPAAEPEKDKAAGEEKAKAGAGQAKGGTKAAGHAPGERWQGTLNLGYGTYSGEIVDGKPDGAGVLTYTSSHQVVSSKDVMAEAGERIEGVFENGKPSIVTLYKKDGNTVRVKR